MRTKLRRAEELSALHWARRQLELDRARLGRKRELWAHKIERLRASPRANSARREVDDLARRLEEARYGPVLSGRGPETAEIARRAEALARRLGIAP